MNIGTLTRWGAITRLLTFLMAAEAGAQSNLLLNSSFETGTLSGTPRSCAGNDLTEWLYQPNEVFRCPQFCPNGVLVARFFPYLAQDVATIPGRRYYAKFASQTNGISVGFGDQVINTLTNIGGTNYIYNQPWFYSYCHVTAVSDVTRFSVFSTQYVTIDDVLLGWLDEPVRLVQQPMDADALQAGSVAFHVQAAGGPPLSYQWYRDSVIVPGATNSLLWLTNVQPSLAGMFHAIVWNPVGSVTSSPALLSVDTTPRAPQIVLEPASLHQLAGSYVTLRTGAIGSPPMRYQWRRNGTNLIGATNSILSLIPLQAEHAGQYEVFVENDRGSALSLPANVSIRVSGNLGLLSFASTLINRKPIYDVDGVTMVTGPTFHCQAYAGPSPDQITAVSTSQVIRTSPAGTYLFPSAYVSLPGTVEESAEGVPMFVQVRAWESAFGNSYELARAQGGKVGISPLMSFVLKSPSFPPLQVSVPSFSLRAGLPGFTTGRISFGSKTPEAIEWILTGAAGYTYLVEKVSLPNHWAPLIVLSNATGVATFTDPEQQSSSVKFYRARMLD
jgi:hypothetical protein